MHKQEADIIKRTVVKSGLILTIISLVTFCVIFYLVGSKFDLSQNEEITSVTGLITSAIEATDTAADTYEELVGLRMLAISKTIAKQLSGRSVSTISEKELIKLREEWDLSDISLFVQHKGDIVVAKSSDPKEVGLSSRSWGYWFSAFEQLFDLQPVRVKEGFRSEHFWVGPLVKSVLYNKQFLYAYYYDGTTDFIINPYISAADVQIFIDAYGPSRLIESMIKSSPDIVEIAVINVEPYLNDTKNSVVEPKKDLPILYGKHTYMLKEDKTVMGDSLLLGSMQTVSFRESGTNYKKIFVPLPENRLITIVLDTSKRDKIIYQILAMMILVYLAAFSVLYFIIKKIGSRIFILVEKIRRFAYFDTLTGLPNRNHFHEYLSSHLNNHEINKKLALFIIDLDNFKDINDTLGHAAGDRFLIDASKRLDKQINKRGFLSRIGGDEFTLVLPTENVKEAQDLALELISSFRMPFQLEGKELVVSMSIGISIYPHDGTDVDSLMKCADTALYYEKYKEKNNFSFFDPIMQIGIRKRF
ncbi:diguanylate cyclase domain-containing protein [Paenibacillus silviterrae]|uniref:diguanylate cyclase domain-containing protein n=1 Tax=Paenibacillus silviterrae TaxID=3242194 RepID=UPI002542F119|nr:diguanylate cyclase [Paenibacillus chinjuensis]